MSVILKPSFSMLALRGRDQIGCKAVGSDIVDVADHLERLGRRVPLYLEGRDQILGSLCLYSCCQRHQRDKRNGDFLHSTLLFFLRLRINAIVGWAKRSVPTIPYDGA